MAKNFRQEGKSIPITGQSANRSAGWLYRRTGLSSAGAKAWVGVIEDDIIGTSSTLTTIDGRPILIGNGVAAEAQTGDGKGDMTIEGVFTFALPQSGMLIRDADPLYMLVSSVTSIDTIASGVTNNQNANSGAFDRHALSGALVGFAVGGNYTGATAPFVGLNVVDVKLMGLPLQGLAAVGPATAN